MAFRLYADRSAVYALICVLGHIRALVFPLSPSSPPFGHKKSPSQHLGCRGILDVNASVALARVALQKREHIRHCVAPFTIVIGVVD